MVYVLFCSVPSGAQAVEVRRCSVHVSGYPYNNTEPLARRWPIRAQRVEPRTPVHDRPISLHSSRRLPLPHSRRAYPPLYRRMRSCRGLFGLAAVAAAAAAASLSVEASAEPAGKDPSAAPPQAESSSPPAATLFESAKAVLECHVCKVREGSSRKQSRPRSESKYCCTSRFVLDDVFRFRCGFDDDTRHRTHPTKPR